LIDTQHEYDRHGLDVLGAHGYDNKFPDMHAVFFTAGPAAERLKARARGGADGWKSSSPAVMKCQLISLEC
jgi:hypothetical protein